MTYSREEIEKAISELKEKDLYITRTISVLLCTMDYNMRLHYFTGEERKSYIKFWKGKMEATLKELGDSKTVESIFEILCKFDDELVEYVKAEKVKSAAEAMEIAHSFIKKYSPVALPMKAEKEGDVWLVDVDVGALVVKIAKIKVDARTGDILSYEIPSK